VGNRSMFGSGVRRYMGLDVYKVGIKKVIGASQKKRESLVTLSFPSSSLLSFKVSSSSSSTNSHAFSAISDIVRSFESSARFLRSLKPRLIPRQSVRHCSLAPGPDRPRSISTSSTVFGLRVGVNLLTALSFLLLTFRQLRLSVSPSTTFGLSLFSVFSSSFFLLSKWTNRQHAIGPSWTTSTRSPRIGDSAKKGTTEVFGLPRSGSPNGIQRLRRSSGDHVNVRSGNWPMRSLTPRGVTKRIFTTRYS